MFCRNLNQVETTGRKRFLCELWQIVCSHCFPAYPAALQGDIMELSADLSTVINHNVMIEFILEVYGMESKTKDCRN